MELRREEAVEGVAAGAEAWVFPLPWLQPSGLFKKWKAGLPLSKAR